MTRTEFCFPVPDHCHASFVPTMSASLCPITFFSSFIVALSAMGMAIPAIAADAAAPNTTSADAGFVAIFDGHSLAGWDGDPKYWHVEDGCIVGEVTPATILKQNTFLIWRGGVTRDFELKAEYRITAQGNSGINYRSTEVEGQRYVMRGYQADIDGPLKNKPPLRHTGQNYEERGRTFLARRGEMVQVDASAKPTVIGSLGDTQELVKFIHNDGWNEYHLIARGNVLTRILNGHVMSIVIDDDPVNRRLDGLLGVQVHVGPPMKVEFRNLVLKPL
jgi:hypothetical protein